MSLVLIIPLLLLGLALLFVIAIHLGFRAPRVRERGTPADLRLPFKAVNIPTRHGRQLRAWLIPSASAEADRIILLHGWGANMEMLLPLALPFHRAGMEVVLFDARNHGLSDGHGHSSLPRFAEDLHGAIDWLKARSGHARGKLALLGHSIGAGAVLLTAAQRDDIEAVIAVSVFAHPERVMRRELKRWPLPEWLLRAVLRYVEWIIGQRFDAIAPIHTVCRVKAPVLLVHGDADRVVPISDARDLIAACPRADLDLLTVSGARHASVDRIEQHSPQLLDFLVRHGFRVDVDALSPAAAGSATD